MLSKVGETHVVSVVSRFHCQPFVGETSAFFGSVTVNVQTVWLGAAGLNRFQTPGVSKEESHRASCPALVCGALDARNARRGEDKNHQTSPSSLLQPIGEYDYIILYYIFILTNYDSYLFMTIVSRI